MVTQNAIDTAIAVGIYWGVMAALAMAFYLLWMG